MARRTGPTQEQKMVVLTRSRSMCERCGVTLYNRPSDIHHRHPRKMGGTKAEWINQPANLVHLCSDDPRTGYVGCHTFIERNREEAKDTGWLVSHREPVDVPVKDVAGIWWELDNDGSKTTISAEIARGLM